MINKGKLFIGILITSSLLMSCANVNKQVNTEIYNLKKQVNQNTLITKKALEEVVKEKEKTNQEISYLKKEISFLKKKITRLEKLENQLSILKSNQDKYRKEYLEDKKKYESLLRFIDKLKSLKSVGYIKVGFANLRSSPVLGRKDNILLVLPKDTKVKIISHYHS